MVKVITLPRIVSSIFILMVPSFLLSGSRAPALLTCITIRYRLLLVKQEELSGRNIRLNGYNIIYMSYSSICSFSSVTSPVSSA